MKPTIDQSQKLHTEVCDRFEDRVGGLIADKRLWPVTSMLARSLRRIFMEECEFIEKKHGKPHNYRAFMTPHS